MFLLEMDMLAGTEAKCKFFPIIEDVAKEDADEVRKFFKIDLFGN